MELSQEWVKDNKHTVDHIVEKFGMDRKTAEDLDEFFQSRINPYYLSLIRYPGDPIRLQCVPAKVELEDFDAERSTSRRRNESRSKHHSSLSRSCSLSCYQPVWHLLPLCTRKRKVGDYEKISMKGLESAFKYLEEHTEIRDVILLAVIHLCSQIQCSRKFSSVYVR